MADLRTSICITEDPASQVGKPLASVVEDDLASGKNSQPALICKNQNDGKLKYLQIDDAGNLLVTMDGGGVEKTARGTAVGNTSLTTVCSIALTAGKVYKGLSWVASCFRDAIFEIVAINDPAGTPTEVILADVLAGSGDLTDSGDLPYIKFTAGATAPVLRLRAKNLTVASDFRGTICTKEDTAIP